MIPILADASSTGEIVGDVFIVALFTLLAMAGGGALLLLRGVFRGIGSIGDAVLGWASQNDGHGHDFGMSCSHRSPTMSPDQLAALFRDLEKADQLIMGEEAIAEIERRARIT